MNTGIREKTRQWLEANPHVKPEAGAFGKKDQCACILGAAIQAMGVAEYNEDGEVKANGSYGIPKRAAAKLGIGSVVAEIIADDFDEKVGGCGNPEWKDFLPLLPE